jgi:hypothetical protein
MSGTQTSSSIRDWCSADAEDIRVLETYMDCIQKQYKNVSNNLIDLLLSLILWGLIDSSQHKMTF